MPRFLKHRFVEHRVVPGGAGAREPEATVMVNALAQGLLPLDAGVDWFRARAEDENRALLRELGNWVQQARGRPDDVPAAVARAGVKPTHTPAVLAAKGRMGTIPHLPVAEHVTAFRLLVALLGVADERRRAQDCAGGCTHWWHRLDVG